MLVTATSGGAGTGHPGALEASLGDRVGDGGEDVLYVVASLGTGLEEEEALLVSVGLGLLGGDLAGVVVGIALVVGKIELVAYEGDDNTGGSLALKLGNPVLGLDEGGGLGEIVNDEGGLGVAVVHGGERGKALLASSVPYLELDRPRGKVALLCEEGG